jgi:hypothetical protein
MNSGQSNFECEYVGKFETEFENIFGYESEDQVDFDDEKYQRKKCRATVPLSFHTFRATLRNQQYNCHADINIKRHI